MLWCLHFALLAATGSVHTLHCSSGGMQTLYTHNDSLWTNVIIYLVYLNWESDNNCKTYTKVHKQTHVEGHIWSNKLVCKCERKTQCTYCCLWIFFVESCLLCIQCAMCNALNIESQNQCSSTSCCQKTNRKKNTSLSLQCRSPKISHSWCNRTKDEQLLIFLNKLIA